MPTIDIPDKICPHCGGTKWFVSYQKYKDKIYSIYQCSNKILKRQKEWSNKNKERRALISKKSVDKVRYTEDYIAKNRKRATEYYKKYPERVKAHSKKSRLKNPDKYKIINRRKNSEYVKSLHDIYIKSLLSRTELPYKEVTPELIEIKRKQLLLKRKIKQNGKEKTTISGGNIKATSN